ETGMAVQFLDRERDHPLLDRRADFLVGEHAFEGFGREQATLGMAPPEQRLDADELSGTQVGDRLEVKLELRPAQAPVGFPDEVEPRLDLSAHPIVERLPPPPPELLRLVERNVRLLE